MSDDVTPLPSLDPSQLAAIFDAFPSPAFATAPGGGQLLAANRAFCDLVGLPIERIVGTRAPHPWTTDCDTPTDAGSRVQTDYQNGRGELVPVELELQAAVDSAGTPVALLCVVTDLSKKRRIDQQLVQNGRLAAVGELAAGVAHEVNNPLFAILGLTEFLAKDAEPHSKAAERLRMIRESGEEIKEIVRALLEFARENPEERQVVPLADVARQTVNLVRRTNAHKGIEIVPSYDDSDARVWASPNQLKQIFLSLMTNARQAMPDGGIVRIDVRRDGLHVVATVTDDGPGVPRDVAGRVFEPFFTTRGAPTGTGLGLSASLGIAEAHGGSLTLDVDRPHGAAFTLRLPIAEEIDE